LNDLVVFHEIAHCIAPRWGPLRRSRRPDEIPDALKLDPHGPGFAAGMAELVDRFAQHGDRDALREAYEHYEVPVLTSESFKAAVADSLEAEAAFLELHAQLEELARRSPHGTGGYIPTWTLGDYLRLMRRQTPGPENRRITQEALAERISKVEPCSRRDIANLERIESLPDSPRLRRIAMCMAVSFELDPIFARHRLGLVRWECHIELDELRLINPDWVALVERMNEQLQTRPPRWVSEGDR
jgi:transcriptional regulator with XRE-family HTH domain